MEVLRYDLIHAIEQKYGSISNCPDSDPILKELESYHGEFRQRAKPTHRAKPRFKKLTETEKLALKYVKRGYSCQDSADMAGISRERVYSLTARTHIRARVPFKCITEGIVIDSYIDAINFAESTKMDYFNYWGRLKKYRELHPGKLVDVNLRWEQIPDGMKYMVSGKIYRKHGIESYLEE